MCRSMSRTSSNRFSSSPRRFAITSWMLWGRNNMVDFGYAQMVARTVITVNALFTGCVLKLQGLLERRRLKRYILRKGIENQRAKMTKVTSTLTTPELFMQWKKKKLAEREAGFAAQMAERARNDRLSGWP